MNPAVNILNESSKIIATYAIPVGAQVAVNEDDEIAPGTMLAKTPRQASKTQDITGGLPRVAELFEARRPKDAAERLRSMVLYHSMELFEVKRNSLSPTQSLVMKRLTLFHTAST